MGVLEQLEEMVEACGIAPLYEEMPKKSLKDKGADGPTAAHAVEELHTPLNIAYTTYTTGSSAFQNPVGIVYEELPARKRAGIKALKIAGISPGSHMLISYPPLVNVFGQETLTEYGLQWSFPRRSGRDGLLAALCRRSPEVLIGESSFLKASLEDSIKMGLAELIPKKLKVIAAGTPLDLGLLDTAQKFPGMEVYDLYGCQEFGWLALNGSPLREDIRLIPCSKERYIQISVGGLLIGDCFPSKQEGHILNSRGEILTYGRERMEEEWVTTILASAAAQRQTVKRMARSILRLKAKIVTVPENLQTGALQTIVGLGPYGQKPEIILSGSKSLGYVEDMLAAQMRYQKEKKNDPSWLKGG